MVKEEHLRLQIQKIVSLSSEKILQDALDELAKICEDEVSGLPCSDHFVHTPLHQQCRVVEGALAPLLLVTDGRKQVVTLPVEVQGDGIILRLLLMQDKQREVGLRTCAAKGE